MGQNFSSPPVGAVQLNEQRALAQTSAFQINIPANSYIDAIMIKENNGAAITGGLKCGTTNGGVDVFAAVAVGANTLQMILDAALLKRTFPTAQTLFFDAVTLWNGASIDLKIVYGNI